jgi:hypothetical protein
LPPGGAASDQSPNGTMILVLGIVGVVFSLLSCPLCCSCLSEPLAAAGWVAYFMGRKALIQYPSCGQTKTGTVLGLITIILSLLGLVASIIVMATGVFTGPFKEMLSNMHP